MGHLGGMRRPEEMYTSPVVEGLDQRKKDLDIGYKADIAQNARFGEVGSVSKRSPIGRYNATVETAAIVGTHRFYRPSTATGYLLQVNSTTLRLGDDSAKSFSTLWTYTGTPTAMMAVDYQDLCYVATDSSNAADNIMVTDGVTAWELGACKAVISADAGLLDTAAVYYYSIGYNTNSDGTSGTATIQGAIVKVTSGTAKGIDLSNIPLGDTGTGSRVIYRSKGGATTLEWVHTIGDNTTQTWTDKAADGVAISSVTDNAGTAVFDCASAHGLQVGDRVTLSGFAVRASYNHSGTVTVITDADSFETGQAFDTSTDTGTWEIGETMGAVTDDVPQGSILYVSQERLFISGITTTAPLGSYGSHICYSDQYLPSWIKTSTAAFSSAKVSGYYDVINEDDGDLITGIEDQLGTTYVFKQNNIYPYYVKGTPGTWSLGDSVSPIGAPAGRSIAKSEFGILYQGWHYVYLFNGQHSQVIYDEFTVDENIASTRIIKSVGFFWNGLYLLAYTDKNAGNDFHDRVMVYDVLRKQGSIDVGGSQSSGSGNVNIGCFTAFSGTTDWNQLYSGDSNLGWVYEYERALTSTNVNTLSGFNVGTTVATITAATIAHVDGGGGADTITDSGSGFLTAGFTAGMKIWVTGSSVAGNNKEQTIVSVVAGTITLATGSVAGDDPVGDTVTITSYQTDAYGTEVNPKVSRPLIDDMESYTDDALAQAAWVSSDTTEAYDANTMIMLHFDEDYDDEGPNNHTVTANNGATRSTNCKFGTEAASFTDTTSPPNATPDYLSVPDHADFDLHAEFTMEAWLYMTSSGTGAWIPTVASTHNDTLTQDGWWWWVDGNEGSGSVALVVASGGSSSYILSGQSFELHFNTWFHCAIVRSAGVITAYINGTAIGTATDATTVASTGDLIIGHLGTTEAGATSTQFLGQIDDFRYSNSARYTSDFIPFEHAIGTPLQCYAESSEVNNTDEIASEQSLKIEAAQASLNDTLSKTIPSINLAATAHDRILVDVYASRSGTNFQLGVGETGGAFTDNLKNVAVATAKTWETVVLDFSSVADASKNAVIYLGIKITDADEDNVIYIDNIRTGFVGAATYASPVYNINAGGGALNKLYWNENLNTSSSTYANDVQFYVRCGASEAACLAAAWSAALTTPSGSDISGTTANDYFQFKVVLTGADSTEYLYFPYLYKASGYVVKATYYQAASDAENEVVFRYSTGFRNYGKPMNDKIYKKVVSMHEGTDGVFELIATTDVQNEQVTSDNVPNVFKNISLATYPRRWTSNFPSNMYGRELKLEFLKSDLNDFKIKQYALVIESCPIL